MEGSPVNSENTHNLDSRVSDFHRPTNSPPSVKSLILFTPIPLLVSLLILYCCWFFFIFYISCQFFSVFISSKPE